MEVNLQIPDVALRVMLILGCIIAYSLVGAVVGGICSRCGFDGSASEPPAELMGVFWPMVLIVFSAFLCIVILWYTLFLPARLLYRAIKNEKEQE